MQLDPTVGAFPDPVIRRLGEVEFGPTWQEMKSFTLSRDSLSADQLWLLQHPPVYTLGLAARDRHLPRRPSRIPVIKTDRGGQITYHGPGQLIVYTLVDLRRLGLGVRQLVRKMEQAVIDLLDDYDVVAKGRTDAPGVYVADAKVASLGLRIRNGCSYHGLAMNVDMDLTPFFDIDPCGYPGLRVTHCRALGITQNIDTLGEKLLAALHSNLWPNAART